MDWIQVIAGAGSIIGFIAAFNWWFLNRIEKDIDKVEKRMENNAASAEIRHVAFEKRMDAFEKRMDSHATRIDQLYGMFVQLLQRERK